ncbi:MAG: ATP-binding cassette domain-containing protein, partial [Steroidobacteraceae bacterium]
RGVALSGGQRQRIGIARALYRNAAVLILDEATNALDGLTEQELVETLGTLRGHCTIVLIAHRLSSLRTCDAIVELATGRIIGSRSYAELVRDPPGAQRVAGVR